MGLGKGDGLGEGEWFEDGDGRKTGCMREMADALWEGHTHTHTHTQK